MPSKNRIMKNNYHTHMYLCRHAKGTIEDYVKKAIELGFDSIGFSDHAPWDELMDRSNRMDPSDYPIYLKQLDEAIEKYSDRIKIYKGLEIEYFNGMDQRYEKLLKDLDYLVLGQHYIEKDNKFVSVYSLDSIEELRIYKDTIINAINTGYFKFIAHPDLFLFRSKKLDDDILEIAEELIIACKKKDIPLEINANGIRRGKVFFENDEFYRYPRKEFWDLVSKHHARVIISSDAHNPEVLYDEAIEQAYKFSEVHSLSVEEELKFD